MGRVRSLLQPEAVILSAGLIMLSLIVIATVTVGLVIERAVRLAQVSEQLTIAIVSSLSMILMIFSAVALMIVRIRTTQRALHQELEEKIRARTAELEAERHLMRTLIDNMPDMIYAKDRESKFILANRAITESMGAVAPAALLGKSDFDFHEPALAEEFRADEVALMTEGLPLINKQEHVVGPDGRVIWLSSTKVPLRDAAGQVVGLVGINRDVTEPRARDAKLREREEQYRRIVENAHEGIVTTNADHQIVYHNARAAEILGYGADELLGQTPLLVVAPQDRDAAKARLRQRREGVRDEADYPFTRKSGEQGWMHVIATPIRDDFDEFAGTLYMFTDITERKRTEDALRQLSRAVEASSSSIVITNAEGTIEYANPAFTAITGYSLAEVVGQNPRVLKSGHTAAAEYAELWQTIKSGKVWRGEFLNHKKNGELYWELASISPIADEDGALTHFVAVKEDITARKQAEERLRRQNEYLDALHETTLGLMGRLQLNDLMQALTHRAAKLVGTRHGYSYVNEPGQDEMEMNVGIGIFEKMIGTKARRGVGVTGVVWQTGQAMVLDDYQTWEGHLAKQGNEELRSIVGIPLKSGAQVVGVFGVAHTDAQRRFDETDVEILTRFAHLAAIALDNARLYAAAERELAERKRAHEQLRERQELLSSVLDTVEDGIYIVGQNGMMTFANRATERMVGAPHQEIASSSYNDNRWKITTLDGEPFPEAEQPYTRVMASGEPVYNVEQSIQRPDGRRIIVSINAAPLHDARGQVIGEVASMSDITERKRAEQELLRQKELLQTVFDHIPVMIGVFDSGGKYTLVNHEWEHTLGYSLADMNRDDVLAALYPEPEHLESARRFMFEPTPGWRDFRAVVRDGHALDTSWAYTRLSDGTTIAFGQDISKRKEVERLKNEFISTVSHELRTPLTSIRGSLGLIAGGVAGALPERARGMIDIAYKNSERLVRLINDILDIEKIESGKMVFHIKPLELMPLVAQAIEANRAYAEQYQVSFVVTAALPGAKIAGDADRMMQVLTNLLSNAAKFSPPGEPVEISVRRVARGIHVGVRDFGPGIPPAFQNRIFQKFAQADSSDTRQKGGTGLGLSIVKAIVEKHGGVIAFDTIPGVGTTFYFELPEWHEPLPAEPAPSLGKPRILICEDDHDVATLLSMMLQQGNFETDVAYSAAQAQELLRQFNYAALTLDLMLPDTDGISLIRELRASEATRHLPIVVVSAKAEQGRQLLNGNAIWVADWLQKPIDQGQLIRAVGHAAQRSPNGRPHILHIEDDADVLEVVAAILRNTAEVSAARDLAHARELLTLQTYDLVILDPSLPDGSGSELLPLLRRQTGQIPVVVFSAHDNEPEMLRQVSAALVKSRTSNEQLLATISQLIRQSKMDAHGEQS